MRNDPYYWTQDNGAGAPVHFAVTYRQIDMLHHILRNCPVAINQRDPRGFTPLHRAAYLAQYDGYLEIYEYLLSEGADPSLRTDDFDPYLDPGTKLPIDVAIKDDGTRDAIRALEEKYASVPKKPEPHADIGDWWALYDYGPETVYGWPKEHKPEYPERRRDAKLAEEKRAYKAKRAAAREAAIAEEVAQLAISGKGAAETSAEAPAAQAAKSEAAATAATPAPPDLDSSPVAFLFPGQGSQCVGMLKSIAHVPEVRSMCDRASAILGYDLLDVCVNGPKSKLDDTAFAQPALFVAGLAAAEKLRADSPDVVRRCSRVAGLSLGEYTALVFAGAMSFEDGLRVVKARAESMKAAAEAGDHGMLSVVGLSDDALRTCVEDAKRHLIDTGDGSNATDLVCEVANYLFPQGRVVSGDRVALEEVTKRAVAAGALKCAPVAVSGAFHTSRMASARDALVAALANVTVTAPKIPVYSNVTGAIVSDASEIPKLLAEQLVSPVLWEQTVVNLLAEGKDRLYELGPNSQIKSMVKRVSNDAWKNFKNVDVAK